MADSKAKDATKKDDKDGKDATGAGGDAAAEKRSKIADLLFLDDDDDFEEFPAEDWTKPTAGPGKEDEKATAWSENWDDDEFDDEFSKKLKAELEKIKTPTAAAATASGKSVPMSH